jgi:hypothetical protein
MQGCEAVLKAADGTGFRTGSKAAVTCARSVCVRGLARAVQRAVTRSAIDRLAGVDGSAVRRAGVAVRADGDDAQPALAARTFRAVRVSDARSASAADATGETAA